MLTISEQRVIMRLLSRLISCDAAGAPLVGETAQETEADIGALPSYRLLVGL